MIAVIQPTFNYTALKYKIEYNIRKNEQGKAEILYGKIEDFMSNCELCIETSLTGKIKEGYEEFILNLVPGEVLSNDHFMKLVDDYMKGMGYENCDHIVIKHNDKKHSHVHIITSRFDRNMRLVNDSYSKMRSMKLSRNLEIKHDLKKTEYKGEFTNKKFTEIANRKYYYYNALISGLKNKETIKYLSTLIDRREMSLLKEPKSYEDMQRILGDKYDKIGAILEDRGHLKKLYKEEMKEILDKIYDSSSNIAEFQEKLRKQGYYMRVLTKKGKTEIVYGIPEVFYIKEDRMHPRMRFENMKNCGFVKSVIPDMQKNYIYNNAFTCLHESSNLQEFKDNMLTKNIRVDETKNVVLFTYLQGDGHTFKGSEVSSQLTKSSIENYLSGQKNEISEFLEKDGVLEDLYVGQIHIAQDEENVNLNRKRKNNNNKKKLNYGRE